MPIITQIKPQKNQKRVNIYLDGKFGFGLDLENFIKIGLKLNQKLTEEYVREIINQAEFQKVLDNLLRFAGIRPHSEKEIRDYLKRKKVNESMQKDLFDRLKRLDLINDLKFAGWWIEQRLQFRPKPRRVLYQELAVKGINKEIINEVLDNTKIPEEKIAEYLLEKKKYRWESLPKLTAKRKMSEFLARKGFGWGVIRKVIKNSDF